VPVTFAFRARRPVAGRCGTGRAASGNGLSRLLFWEAVYGAGFEPASRPQYCVRALSLELAALPSRQRGPFSCPKTGSLALPS
jgi:hypothetical protein